MSVPAAPAPGPPADAAAPLVVDVRGLTKRFNGRTVVNGLDFQIRRGEVYGFLGPNGSGKTTFIRMLCGLLTPDAGEGTCVGHDILRGQNRIKPEVGYMTQRFSYYEDLSIEENLDFVARIYGLRNRREAVAQALERLGLAGRRRQLAGTLSGGWKQRLALAASMIHQPKLLLLDEPTAGVDPKARRDFWEEIHELSAHGLTVLITTHYMDEAERCHRIAYLAYGNLLTRGTVREVIDRAGLSVWRVACAEPGRLAARLRQPGISVVPFGRALHVSSGDPAAVRAAVRAVEGPGILAEPIPATLEDVFIFLMSTSTDNFVPK